MPKGSLAAAVALLACGVAVSVRAAPPDDEFYQSCEVEAEPIPPQSIVADYGCLLSPHELAPRYDLIADVTAMPSRRESYVVDAHKGDFNQLLHKRWMQGKRALVLDEGISTVEGARLCARLLDAGLTEAKVLLGGVRAYLQARGLTEPAGMAMLPPGKVMGAVENKRMRFVMLNEFRRDGEFDSRAARRRVDDLAPAREPEQFMPILLVGAVEEYWILDREDPLPWWVYFLEGGEAAYHAALEQHRDMAAARHVKLRKCAAL